MDRALGWARRNWVLLGALCMFVGSDYKFRLRDVTSSISGSPDVFVLLELALYAALAGYLLAKRASPPRAVRLPAPLVLAGGWGLVILASAPASPFPVFGLVRSLEMFVGIGFALAIAMRATRDELHRLAHGFMVLVSLSVLYGIAVPSQPVSPQQVGRFSWLAIHPILAGVYAGTGVVIAVVYLVRRVPRPGPHWPRLVYALLLAVQLYGLIATHTRGAVLGAVAGILVAEWSRLQTVVQRLEYLLAAAVAAALTTLLALDTVLEYVARGESVEQLSTLNSRTDLWSYALETAAQKPVYGWGVGASQGIFLQEIGLGGGHNMIVNVLVDFGLVGLLVWVALVGSTVARIASIRSREPDDGLLVDRALLLGLLTMILVDGFFFAGPGGVTNVSSTWLLLVVGWTARLCLLRQGDGRRGRRHHLRGPVAAPAPASGAPPVTSSTTGGG